MKKPSKQTIFLLGGVLALCLAIAIVGLWVDRIIGIIALALILLGGGLGILVIVYLPSAIPFFTGHKRRPTKRATDVSSDPNQEEIH